MTSTRRPLTIDDPLAAAGACHVARTRAGGDAGRLRDIRLDQIRPNPKQPRQRFETESLVALADSIREHGVLQPVIVRPREPEGYELIAGERRWRASLIAERETIPALVDDAADDAISLELALIENITRADLTVIEQARTIARYSTTSACQTPTSDAGSGEAAATSPTRSGSSSCQIRRSS